MINRKKKICSNCKLERYLYGKSLCQYCYNKQKVEKAKLKKRNKKISNYSEKAKRKSLEYKKARQEFLADKDHCYIGLPGCLIPYPVFDKSGLEVHHMQGRGNQLLTDKRKFLCVCRFCHEFITRNSLWSIENGYSISKFTKDVD